MLRPNVAARVRLARPLSDLVRVPRQTSDDRLYQSSRDHPGGGSQVGWGQWIQRPFASPCHSRSGPGRGREGRRDVLVPVTARKQLNDLPDDMITRVNIVYYSDAKDALLKAVLE